MQDSWPDAEDGLKNFLKAQIGPIVFAAFLTAPLYLRWIYEAWR
jgi:hypothetical protein